MALLSGGIIGMIFLLAGRRGGKSERVATLTLAIVNLCIYPLNLWAWLSIDTVRTVENFAPLQMCDLATIFAGLALLTRRPLLAAMTYFWGMGATLQALITPALTIGFPSPPFIMFFVQHFVVVIAALYVPLVHGWRPKSPLWRSPLEVFGISMVYLAFVMVVNHFLGSNFAFVSHPPENPSLIDHLGPWPWYVVALALISLAVFELLALPFIRRRNLTEPPTAKARRGSGMP